jgi:hypothetical protein
MATKAPFGVFAVRARIAAMKNPTDRSGAVALVVAALLLVAYPLSAGPAACLYQCMEWGPLTLPLDRALRVIYSPAFDLPDPVGDWVSRWWSYGTDLGAELY